MDASDVQSLIIGAVQGLGVSTIFLLALFIGFCVILGLPKLWHRRRSRVVRSLDERVGEEAHARYLPPDAPRGPADQLRSPELVEAEARKSG